MVNKSPGSFSWPHEEWPQVPFGEETGTLIWQLSCWAGSQTHLLISPHPMSWGQANSFYKETFSLRRGVKPLPTLFRDHRAHPHEVQWIYRVCAHQILLLWPQDLHDLECKGLCPPQSTCQRQSSAAQLCSCALFMLGSRLMGSLGGHMPFLLKAEAKGSGQSWHWLSKCLLAGDTGHLPPLLSSQSTFMAESGMESCHRGGGVTTPVRRHCTPQTKEGCTTLLLQMRWITGTIIQSIMVPLKFGAGSHRGANLFIPTKKYHRLLLYSFWRHQLIISSSGIECPPQILLSFLYTTLFTPSLLTTHTHTHTHTHVWVFLTHPSSLPPHHSQAAVLPKAASCAWKMLRGTKYRCSCLVPFLCWLR